MSKTALVHLTLARFNMGIYRMKGIHFIVDENNQKMAVLIDLNEYKGLWQIIESHLSVSLPSSVKTVQRTQHLQPLVSSDELIQPLDEIWENYH